MGERIRRLPQRRAPGDPARLPALRTASFALVLLLAATAAPAVLHGQSAPGGDGTDPIDYSRTVVLFYGERCPHCHDAINYLETVVDAYPELTFVRLEVSDPDNQANRVYFHRTMARLESQATGYPRLVIGDRVYAGFTESSGPLQWMESHQAYAGFQNQIAAALEDLHARAGRAPRSPGPNTDGRPADTTDGHSRQAEPAGPPVAAETDLTIEPIRSRAARAAAEGNDGDGADRTAADAAAEEHARSGNGINAGKVGPGLRGAIVAAVLALYTVVAVVLLRRRGEASGQRIRLWVGGGVLLAMVGIFAVVAGMAEGAVAETVRELPFPLLVTAIALLDGFNPCAFTVLFILLSLLTYAQRRRHMIAVGGVFVAASAAVYVVFIFAIIAVGSFALANIGTWILRVIGAGVLIMGVIGIYELLRPGAQSRVASLSEAEKTGLSRRAAGVVRRFTDATTPGARLAALGATAVLAVVVNSVELGCTAILPAVYMSSLISTFGAQIGIAHVAWTLWYGVVYIVPMAAILVNFVITFRSDRLSVTQGRRLKLVGSAVMIVLGGVLAIAPQSLTF